MTINLPKKLFAALIISAGLLVFSTADARAATFSLSPTSGSTVSGTFSVTLSLTDLAGKEVSGVDVYLNYEPGKLEAQEISTTGGIFTSYPLKTIDSTGGKIAIGASASAFSPVTTSGTIATITFKALATSGSTTLSFDYTAGSTTDSNITESGTATDILTQPPTVTYNLSAAAAPTPSPTPTPTPPAGDGDQKGVAPDGGILEPTAFISILSLIMIGLGVLLKIKSGLPLSFEEKILNKVVTSQH